MKARLSLTGLLTAAALIAAGCSHGQKSENTEAQQKQQAGQSQQAGQMQQGQHQQAQNQQAQNQLQPQQKTQTLGEEKVATGNAQITRQKKVLRTVIVKEDIPTVKESTIRADINRMSAKQFTAIGFPSDVSQNIIQYREQKGQFGSVDDLSNVDGVTQSMLDRLDGALGVNGSSQAGQAQIDSHSSLDQSQSSAKGGVSSSDLSQ